MSTKESGDEKLGDITRQIKADDDYRGYDFLELYFTDRYEGWPLKGFAVVALTDEGERAVEEWPKDPYSADGGVYFFRAER